MVARIALPGRGRQDEPEWAVWLTLLVALLLGLVLQSVVTSRTETAEAAGVRLSYPASWSRQEVETSVISLSETPLGVSSGATVTVQRLPKPELLRREAELSDAASSWAINRGRDLVGYRALGITPSQASGREAMTVEYAYVGGSAMGAVSGAIPSVIRATDTIVSSGDGYLVLSFSAERQAYERLTKPQFPRLQSVYEQIVRSWRVP
jgi:hypothetical protein